MPTRTYTGTLPINPEQLGSLIDTALSRTGDVVTLLEISGSPLVISVTHPSLTSADDATINSVIAAYVFNPNFQTAAQIAASRAGAIALVQGLDAHGKILRAVAVALLNQLNTLRASYPIPVTSITRVTTVATVTTAVAHGLSSGQVFVWGAPQTGYNGLQTITVTGATTFTYTVAGSPTTPATPGALIVYPVSGLFSQVTMAQVEAAIQAIINAGTVDTP